MRETYIRPWYKTVGLFFLYELMTLAMMLYVCSPWEHLCLKVV